MGIYELNALTKLSTVYDVASTGTNANVQFAALYLGPTPTLMTFIVRQEALFVKHPFD